MRFLKLTGYRGEQNEYGPPVGFDARDWQGLNGIKFVELASAWDWSRSPFVYSMDVGVGAGKTIGVAWLVSHALNERYARRVVYVAPNRSILEDAIRDFRSFGIHLVNWENGKFPHGEPALMDGLGMTYASLVNCREIQRRLCKEIPTILCLDEFHHLGDDMAWNGAVQYAFEPFVKVVLPFSGTCSRDDKKTLAFMEKGRIEGKYIIYKTDFSYPLGRCIKDKICRNPIFEILGGTVEIPGKSGRRVVDFDRNTRLSKEDAALRLRGAVRHGTATRIDMMSRVIKRVMDGDGKHRAAFYLGGTSRPGVKSVKDARDICPAELIELGVPRDLIDSVYGEESAASRKKLRAFNDSDKLFLICVGMFDEGINIPKIDTAAFLSTVTAKQKLIQRIGRVLRGTGHAAIYGFADPSFVQVARDIEDEVAYHRALCSVDGPDEPGRESRGRREPGPIIEPRGLEAWLDAISIHGHEHSPADYDRVREMLEANGIVADTDRICTTLELVSKGLISLGEAVR